MDSLNKKDMAEALAAHLNWPVTDAKQAIDGVIHVLQREVAKGEKVALAGFGTFEKVTRAARTTRNPQTGGTVAVPEQDVPKFRSGSVFRAVVSGK
jgi:DNA-binding protein HU-beta